jgi:ribosomal protein S18 acetylase RimI-like enzyme
MAVEEVLGISIRPLRFTSEGIDADDLDVGARLYEEAETPLIGAARTGSDELGAFLEMPTTDRGASVLLEHHGEPIGILCIENDATARQTYADMAIPSGPSAQDARRLAVDLCIAAATSHSNQSGGLPWTLRCGHWLGDEGAEAELARQGFSPVRRFYGMRIDSTSPEIPDREPPLPDGVEVIVARKESHFRDLHLIDNESFLDHWNFTPRGWEEWWEHFGTLRTRDPHGWWLLRVDGVPAGLLMMDESRADTNDGYIGIVGVRREFRGRGLAQLLLRRAFLRYREMGRAGTQLGVDAENQTGAVALYEKVGMTAIRTYQGWALELP